MILTTERLIRIVANGMAVWAVGDLEPLSYPTSRKFNKSTNDEWLTKPPIAYDRLLCTGFFTNFTNTLNKIADHFGKQAVRLDGSTSKSMRQHAVDQFQDNEKITVFVGNLKAAGVGLTLTAAEAVIMNDLSFVPSDHTQAEDRAYRYGQKSNVSVYYPIFENTIEGAIYDILIKKKNIFETVMGDNLDKADFIEEVMNRINNRR